MTATAGGRWQAVAAVVAVVVAVMAGQAASHDARAVEPKDIGETPLLKNDACIEQFRKLTTEMSSSNRISIPTNPIDAIKKVNVTELINLIKLIKQFHEINYVEIANIVNILNKTEKFNYDDIINLISFVNQTNDVDVTQIGSILDTVNPTQFNINATTNDTKPTVNGTITNSTGVALNFTGCTNKPTEVLLDTWETYTFSTPGFPNSSVGWFSDCRYKFKAKLDDDELLINCTSKRLSWFTSFSYTNRSKTVWDNCCIFCGGDRPFNSTVGNSTEIKYATGLFGAGGLNCSVRAEPPPCECGAYTKSKVTGGSEAAPLAYGWMATLENKADQTHVCGASLITPRWLLTGADCVADKNTSMLQVRLGVHNRTAANTNLTITRNLLKVVMHPKYNDKQAMAIDYDYALLKVAPINMTQHSHVKAVCLASGNASYVGSTATILGWGSTHYLTKNVDVLMEGQVNVTSNQYCQKQWTIGALKIATITDRMMCARSPTVDACVGDNGGPLFLKNTAATQIAVATSYLPCAFHTFMGIYARVTEQRAWIDETVRQTCKPVTK